MNAVLQHAELLGRFGHLGVIPDQWPHSTVQGVFHGVTAEQLRQLEEEARAELADVAPFDLQLGPTWPGVTAITVAVYPEGPMAALNHRVRAAAERVEGIELRPPAARFWPHTSLAYAKAQELHPADDVSLNPGAAGATARARDHHRRRGASGDADPRPCRGLLPVGAGRRTTARRYRGSLLIP